jgi:hypothetical protein
MEKVLSLEKHPLHNVPALEMARQTLLPPDALIIALVAETL